jgi:hypothetical protein
LVTGSVMGRVLVRSKFREAGLGFLGVPRRTWAVLDIFTTADGQQHVRIGAVDDPSCYKTLAAWVLRHPRRYTLVREALVVAAAA